LSRRLDDLTHQMRMLTLSFSTFQLEQRQQRHTDRWDLAEDTQKALAEMLKIQQTVLEHQRTINGRLAMYVEQQTAINDRLATTLALACLLAGLGRAARGRTAVPGADGGVDAVDGSAHGGARQVARLHHGLCTDGGGDRLLASLRCRLRVCTVLVVLNLLGTLVVLVLVLARR